MPVSIRHKVNVKVPGLKNANPYLADEYSRAAYHLGYRLQEDIRNKQRKDTGQERARTLFKVTTRKGGLNVLLNVYNTSIQGAVDETGAKPHFPPYKAGSKLFGWVSRKGLAITRSKKEIGARQTAYRRKALEDGANRAEANAISRFSRERDSAINTKRIERVAFAIAKVISRRGLPRPGDALRKPFETVRRKADTMIRTIFNFATLKAVKRINDEGK